MENDFQGTALGQEVLRRLRELENRVQTLERKVSPVVDRYGARSDSLRDRIKVENG